MKNNPYKSITLQTSILVGLLVFACFLVLGWVVERSVDRHFLEQDTRELSAALVSINRLLEENFKDETKLKKELEAVSVAGGHGVYFGVFNAAEKLIYSNKTDIVNHALSRNVSRKSLNSKTLSIVFSGASEYRMVRLTKKINETRYSVVLAVSIECHKAFMKKFQDTLWLIILLSGFLCSVAIFVFIRLGLRPLHVISKQIGEVSTKDLSRRLKTQGVPIELYELVTSFNNMIDKVEVGYATLNNFSADIAHEFRTPLANLSLETQVILTKERSIIEYQNTLCSHLEEFERLGRMVKDMLWLAKTDNAQLGITLYPVQMDKAVHSVLDYFSSTLDEKSILVHCDLEGVVILGDDNILRRALSNLISNAVRHTPDNGKISIHLFRSESKNSDSKRRAKPRACLEVKNTGLTIPSETLERLFDRFYQVDRARNSVGTGLGLSIVKAIIELHKGSITCSSSEGVTIFSIELPLKPSSGAR